MSSFWEALQGGGDSDLDVGNAILCFTRRILPPIHAARLPSGCAHEPPLESARAQGNAAQSKRMGMRRCGMDNDVRGARTAPRAWAAQHAHLADTSLAAHTPSPLVRLLALPLPRGDFEQHRVHLAPARGGRPLTSGGVRDRSPAFLCFYCVCGVTPASSFPGHAALLVLLPWFF
ncbi:hypothetical protein JB92DRAFT_3141153 [Gautieria morchelliformis]|nr:hypothetical protein JB92DRAFT_3141153 [Gautieria morchelliformis]